MANATTIDEPEKIRPRRVRFDWSGTPLHWIPGDATTTHIINVLHLLLPAGERWFVRLFKEALPLIEDPDLYDRVRGFMGQEGVHAVSHSFVLDHLRANGLDPTPYTDHADWLFEDVLGSHDRFLPGPLRRLWFNARLAGVAGIEHYTAVLGQWIIDESHALDEAGADEVMLDLLRWHGAEEVEHRSVAYDLYQHLGGSYPLRAVVAWLLVFPLMNLYWYTGTTFLLRRDPLYDGPTGLRATGIYRKGSRRGRLPTYMSLALAGFRYLLPTYHPSKEGDLASALAYIERSPSHLAAARPADT